jgi:hypothetical protein
MEAMKRNLTLLAACALAVGLIAAGCGSSNDNNTTTTSSITKAEFVTKANAICQQGNQAINQAGNSVFGKGQKPSQDQLNSFATDTIIPNVQKQLDDIKALGFPDDQAAKIVNDAQSTLDKAKADPSVLTAQGQDPFADVNKEARAYGLTVCGSNG